MTAELHCDGSGATDPARHDTAGLFAGRRQTVGRRYAGLYARHEFTPLLIWENWLARSLDDRSWYYSPRLTHAAHENVELAVGCSCSEVPSSEATIAEATDYFTYFCGLECHEQWKHRGESPSEERTESLG